MHGAALRRNRGCEAPQISPVLTKLWISPSNRDSRSCRQGNKFGVNSKVFGEAPHALVLHLAKDTLGFARDLVIDTGPFGMVTSRRKVAVEHRARLQLAS